jgi:very-short-patch-repair endonuclease
VSVTQASIGRARKLRQDMTEAERRVWAALRGHRLTDLHFRRQKPIGPYVADFCCHAAKVVIEVDGGQHGFGSNLKRDRQRDRWFEEQGYLTLRFWNHEVFTQLAMVKETIFWRCFERLHADHALKRSPPVIA